MNGVPLGDVDLEMDMVFGEAEFAELKTKAFQVPERLSAGVDVALFSEVPVSVVRGKHHGDPVVSCVSRWLFIATAIYIFHAKFSPVAPIKGQANACRVRQKEKSVDLLKGEATFHLRVLRCCSGPRSIPSRNISNSLTSSRVNMSCGISY